MKVQKFFFFRFLNIVGHYDDYDNKL
jgi:hypothetical protein